MKTLSPTPAAEEQASLWAARIEGSSLSAIDRTLLDDWLAADPAHRALLSQYCQLSTDLEQLLPALVASGGTTLPAPSARNHRQAFRIAAGLAIGAAAAVAILLWFGRPGTEQRSIATPSAQRQALKLADGTLVELNAQTSLQIEITSDIRRVRLASGQAFFGVSKDKTRPFTVETPAGSVRVTGTEFAVRAETASELEVLVAEGVVQVRPADFGLGHPVSPVMLHSGERLTAGPDGVARTNLSAKALNDALAWRGGQIVFDGVQLSEALARFARYHGQGITATPDAAQLRIGGRFSLDDLNGFLTTLEEVLPVRVARGLNGTVQVTLANSK